MFFHDSITLINTLMIMIIIVIIILIIIIIFLACGFMLAGAKK